MLPDPKHRAPLQNWNFTLFRVAVSLNIRSVVEGRYVVQQALYCLKKTLKFIKNSKCMDMCFLSMNGGQLFPSCCSNYFIICFSQLLSLKVLERRVDSHWLNSFFMRAFRLFIVKFHDVQNFLRSYVQVKEIKWHSFKLNNCLIYHFCHRLSSLLANFLKNLPILNLKSSRSSITGDTNNCIWYHYEPSSQCSEISINRFKNFPLTRK